MNTFTSQAQQFAAVYAGKLAKRQLRTIAIVSIASKLITAGVAIISYRHQSGTLMSWNAPTEIAMGLPALADLLTIVCVLAISTPALIPAARKWGGRVIAFPILVSSAINFAGHGELGVKLVALTLPIFIPLAEIVGSVLKPDFAEMDRIERAAYAVAAPTAPIDEEARAKRAAAAAKGAQTRREKDEAEAARKAERAEKARLRREAKQAIEAAPVSPGAPVTGGYPTADELVAMTA